MTFTQCPLSDVPLESVLCWRVMKLRGVSQTFCQTFLFSRPASAWTLSEVLKLMSTVEEGHGVQADVRCYCNELKKKKKEKENKRVMFLELILGLNQCIRTWAGSPVEKKPSRTGLLLRSCTPAEWGCIFAANATIILPNVGSRYREHPLSCGNLGEASWAPCMSQGLVGTGVGREVSHSHKKAELKPLWRRALPAAAPRALLGKLPCCAQDCKITNRKRILNWFLFFVLFFSSSF